MAITYGFYNSMNGDRKYDAVQLSSIFDGVIRDGVFQSIGGYLATKPGTGMQVLVSPGKAWFDHTWTVNDADLPLDISPSDLTLSRYDAVVLETDATKSVRENSIKVIKGTPASAPQKPTLTNEGDVHQHPLAYILVPGGSSSIQVQNIDIMVGKTECPFVTSILESVSIEALLEKWEGEFRVWFGDLQDQMSGDVATNLQNQITKNAPKVGDIVISSSLTRNTGWILCNGTEYDPVENPKLKSILESSTRIDESLPIVPSCAGAVFVGDMAFYRDKYDKKIAYPSKKTGGPDFTKPINSYDLVESTNWNLLISYANGLYIVSYVTTGVVNIAYSRDGKDWNKRAIQPESGISSNYEISSVLDIKYMKGYYYIIFYCLFGTFYIATTDLLSMDTYSQSDMKSILSQNGIGWVYLNNNEDTIYFLSSGTSSEYLYKITGPASCTNEGFGRSAYHMDHLRMFELDGKIWAITGRDTGSGDYVYAMNNTLSISTRIGVREDLYPRTGSIIFDVFTDKAGNVYYTYGGILYKAYPGASLDDFLKKPYGTFPIFAGISTGIIGKETNQNSHAFYVDLESGVFVGSEFFEFRSINVVVSRCRNNSPNITPYIASDFGYAFIKGDQE